MFGHNLTISPSIYKIIRWQLTRHNKLFQWNAPSAKDYLDILGTKFIEKTKEEPLSASLIERNSSSLYKKLYLSTIKTRSLRDFNSHNKWQKHGFIYGKEDIIKGCQNINSTSLSGRVLSVCYKHQHQGYMQPLLIKKLGLNNEEVFCKLCGEKDIDYQHLFVECEVSYYIRILLEERFYRSSQKITRFTCHDINILSFNIEEKETQKLKSQFTCSYKFHIHMFHHKALSNIERTNPKIPLQLVNTILSTVQKASNFKIPPFKNIPPYLSYCKKNTPSLSQLLKTHPSDDILFPETMNQQTQAHSLNINWMWN